MPGGKKYLQGGTVALMNDKNIKPGTLVEGTQGSPDAEMRHLLARMDDMQMEIDILKETINVLKKDPGINTETLKNSEKAAVVDGIAGHTPCSAAREPSSPRKWCAGPWPKRGLRSESRAGGNIALTKGKSRLLCQMR